MQNKMYVDDEGIIVIEVVGDQDEASVEQMGLKINELITEQRSLGKPVLLLDNILQIGTVQAEARKLVVQLGKELDYDRGALLGQGGLMRFGSSLMLRATGQARKLRYFDDEAEARAWLRAIKSNI
jgi:stage II sporulation SpoAA-like protein